MLVGILCEVVSAVAASEKDEIATSMLKRSILVVLKHLDDGTGVVDREEFSAVFREQCALNLLGLLKVDKNHLNKLRPMLFDKRKEMSISDVLELILKLRGDRSVELNDMIDLTHFAIYSIKEELRKHSR